MTTLTADRSWSTAVPRPQARRTYAPRRVPVAAAVAAPFALICAFFPSYLPHQPLTLGVLLALAWVTVHALVSRGVRWARPRATERRYLTERTRTLAVVAGGLSTIAITAGAVQVQNAMRARIGMGPLTAGDLVVAVGAAAAVLLLARGARGVWQHRARWWRPVGALAIAGMLSGAALPADMEPNAAASAQEQVLLQPATHGAVRAYAALADEPDVTRRAALAADRLARAGGLDKRHVVIAMPTGSGWVDPQLVTGLEQRFGSEVATVAMQYDDRPSWLSYLLGQSDAENGARAVVEAVSDAVRRLPEAQRPQLHVVGESLGATAGQAIFEGPSGAENRQRVCSTMWVGTPGGDGVDAPREVLVANPDDPIVHARPSMLVLPPGDGRPWLPVVSGVQAATDYLGSLAVPTGSGHRYGPDQADRLRTC